MHVHDITGCGCACNRVSKAVLTMLAQLAGLAKDVSVIRRLTFASSFYLRSMPNYWEHVTSFGALKKESRCQLSPATTKLLIENMTMLDVDAFASDEALGR